MRPSEGLPAAAGSALSAAEKLLQPCLLGIKHAVPEIGYEADGYAQLEGFAAHVRKSGGSVILITDSVGCFVVFSFQGGGCKALGKQMQDLQVNGLQPVCHGTGQDILFGTRRPLVHHDR